ncbi:unnamed protein product [Pylaiella littoralis]
MCGRSRQTVAPQALATAVGFRRDVPLRRASQYRRRENAHPGNATPIAYKTSTGGSALRSMRWGLVPSFTKKGAKPEFFKMFNARSETATEKPSFRGLVGRRHGVVAFTGFYEWKKDDSGKKQPYYFHYADNRPMLFAVLYDTWQHGGGSFTTSGDDGADDGDGQNGDSGGGGGGGGGADTANSNSKPGARRQESQLKQAVLKLQESEDQGQRLMFSYAVLTTSAAPRLTWLHERMPVILRGARDAAAWLSCKGAEASTFLKNHVPYSDEDLVWHPVSKQMNDMGYEGEDCSAAIELKKTDAPLQKFFKKVERPPATAVAAGEDASNGSGSSAGSSSVGNADKRSRSDATEKGGGHEARAWARAGAGAAAGAAAAAVKPPISSPSPPSTPKTKRMRTRSQGGGLCGSGVGGSGDDGSEGIDVASSSTSVSVSAAPAALSAPTAAAAGTSRDAFSPLRKAATAKAMAAATVTFQSRSPRKSPKSPGRSGPGARAAAAASKDSAQCKLTSLWQKPPG